ncbi:MULTISPECIES: sulfurtransferase TusA family protein [Vibrio harveyi group]
MELDTRGYPCPEPVAMTKVKLRHMNYGDSIVVINDTPSCIRDLQRLCTFLDHTLIAVEYNGPIARVTIRKGLEGEDY